ncbi:MAG TPA: phospholipase D-like domain-containing protein [Chlamydiales bacterium]|nr:phospholipase D-like domain-containing protein [Chlamydiales bacterium]
MRAITPTARGFGDYALPPAKTFTQMQCSAKVRKVFFTLLFASLATLSFALIPVSMPIALLGAAIFSYHTVKSLVATVALYYRAPPTPFPNPPHLPQLGALAPCSGFVTQNGVESHEWKLHLIRSAKNTLFISGCYCGGRAFDETLDLIRERMRLLPTLSTAILSSNIFISPENRRRIEQLTREFNGRFRCVISPEVFPYVSPTTDRLSLSTNHTKALVIDHGAAFLVGGSGLVSAWSQQKGETLPKQLEQHGFLYDSLMQIRAYRDLDFVFQSPDRNGIGALLHTEMSKLFNRFSPQPLPISYPIPVPPLALPRALPNLNAALYVSGPEQPSSLFLNNLVAKVRQATRTIFIGHLYFHPPKKLLQALIDASNRGVRITLIINRNGHRSPASHSTFAELSRFYAKALYEGKVKPHIELYEYDVPHTTYHKKAIVIDQTTSFIGSSNLGYKSLSSVDYEVNCQIESPAFAASLTQSLEADKRFCRANSTPHITLKTRLLSFFQSFLTPFQ